MQKYFDEVQKTNGDAVSGASVLIKKADGTAALIYTADGSGLVSNSTLTTDARGYFEFYGPDGDYSATITHPEITTRQIDDITLFDPLGVRFYVKNAKYGATDDGTADDAAAIQAAIDDAEAGGGGSVILGHNHAIGTKLTVQGSGVKLYGYGARAIHDVAATTPTVLKWIGADGGDMIEFSPVEGASNPSLDNVGLIGVSLFGEGLAGNGLVIKSVKSSEFDVYVGECKTNNILFGVVTTLGEGRDTQYNIFRLKSRNNNAAGTLMRAQGDSGANVSLNLFEYFEGWHKDNDAVICENVDNNTWIRTRIFRAAAGTASNSIVWQGGDTESESARNETFLHLTATMAPIAKGTGTYTVAAQDINILQLDKGNATPDPTVETAASVYWGTNDGVWGIGTGYQNIGIGNSAASAADARDNVGTSSLRINNGSSNHAVLDNGTERWAINIDGGTGDLRLSRQAGTGVVSMPISAKAGASRRLAESSGTTGGAGSAGAGNQYIEITVNGTTYKVLHDGTV